MSLTEQIIIVAVVVAGTMVTRFLPFIIFPANKKTPPAVLYLGKMLPAAVMGLLVVYSLKDVHIIGGYHGLPEALSLLLLVAVQVLTKNILLTIAGSTIFYMFLVQYVFI